MRIFFVCPLWFKRLFCRHHWRYNTMDTFTGMPMGLLWRYCQHCGQWQERDIVTMTWKNMRRK